MLNRAVVWGLLDGQVEAVAERLGRVFGPMVVFAVATGAAALAEALDRYERKQNIPLARQVRERLTELKAGARPI